MRVWMREQLQEIGSSTSLSSSRAWRRGKTQQATGSQSSAAVRMCRSMCMEVCSRRCSKWAACVQRTRGEEKQGQAAAGPVRARAWLGSGDGDARQTAKLPGAVASRECHGKAPCARDDSEPGRSARNHGDYCNYTTKFRTRRSTENTKMAWI